MAIPQQLGQLQGAYRFPSYGSNQDQGFLSRFFMGTPDSYQQLPRFMPQQYDILSRLLSGGLSNLQNPYQGFEGIEQYSTDQFNRKIVPRLAEQFSAMGGSPGGSSGFAGLLGEAGSGLAGLLGAQRAQYGQQNQSNALNQLRLGLTDPFDTQRRERQPGFFEQGFNAASQSIPSLASLLPFLL